MSDVNGLLASLGGIGAGDSASFEEALRKLAVSSSASASDGKKDFALSFAVSAALLGCFIHSRMGGVVYVADSAWTVKTGPNGVAMLEDVPEGAVTLKVWHASQLVDKAPQTLTMTAVPAKATLQLDVVVKRRG